MRHVFLDKKALVMKEAAQPFLDDHMVLISIHSVFLRSPAEVAALAHVQQKHAGNVPQRVKKVLELVTASSHKKYGTARAASHSTHTHSADTHAAPLSCSGRIIAVGKKVKMLAEGDWVACFYHTQDMHTQVVCVPEQAVVRIAGEQHARSASAVASGVLALGSIRRAQLALGDRVCVVGLGFMGNLLAQLAKITGCFVIGIEGAGIHTNSSSGTTSSSQKKSQAQAGAYTHPVTGPVAERVYNTQEHDIFKEIMMATHQQGVDALFITAEMAPGFLENQPLDTLIRAHGRLIIVDPLDIELACAGLYKKEIDIAFSSFTKFDNYGDMYGRELEALESHTPESRYHSPDNYNYARRYYGTQQRAMQAFIELLYSKKIDIEELLASQEGAGTIISYTDHDSIFYKPAQAEVQEPFVCDSPQAISFKARFNPALRDTIRLGFVGVGDFSKRKLLPIVSHAKNTRIEALFDVNITQAMQLSRTYGVARVYTREQELFASEDVDAVIIASPHTYHTDQVLHALQQGKAVFLENPMATSQEQLQQMRLFLSCYKQAPFCIDYNRSFSPFIKKIKAVVEKRIAPLMIIYRMNVGFIPKENWIQTEVGAGRIIGEASHILDLFCMLTNANPVSVSVETMHAARDDLFPTDNFSVQIRFDDGSLCILVYTAVGHGNLGKERMELFVDGKTMVLDDYVRLVGFGVPAWFNETVLARDKGHEALLHAFLDSLRNPEYVPPISFERLCTVAELSLLIDQLACQGGGFKEW
jgi:predicted dehydrogenase